MSKYIELEDVLKALVERVEIIDGVYSACAALRTLPTIDIVHCKDCKYLRYCETEDLDMYLDCDCPDGGGIPRNEDWYCADGERIGNE